MGNLIIILGAPGSGKGTISSLLEKDYGYTAISTGDLLREEKASKSAIGNKIAALINEGNFVPNELIEEILFKKIKSMGDTDIVVDGYPRNIEQAKNLDDFKKPDSIIFLHIDHIEAKKRILERGKTSGREDDKNEETIMKRMQIFSQETAPIIAYYYNRSVNIINSGRPLDEVYSDIKNLFQL
jgi:adenylate kinase family enzyme